MIMTQHIDQKKQYLSFLIIFLTAFFLSGELAAGEIKYGTGSWNADSLGNHRVVVTVTESSDAVLAHIPWRRRDRNPQDKNIIIIDAGTGNRISNICRVTINREVGDIVLQPVTVPGDYYIYYLPYRTSGRRNYPTVTYPPPEATAQAQWLERHELTPDRLQGQKWRQLPRAKVVAIQSIDQFNSFYPMEVIATAAEVATLVRRHPSASYLLFPEDRSNPIRMTDDLPYKWIKDGVRGSFEGTADRGEYYAFQVGVFAVKSAIKDLEVRFSDLKQETGTGTIPAAAFTCFNTEGINWIGEPMDKICPVEKGKVQPLWMGVAVPKDIPPGKYHGIIRIVPVALEQQSIKIVLTVTGRVRQDAGDDEPWRHSRLRWLNSRIAIDHGIVPPFTPMQVQGNTVSCLGRSVVVGKTGLPRRIESFFAPEVTHLVKKATSLLAAPMVLVIEDNEGEKLGWQGRGFKFTDQQAGAVSWRATGRSGVFQMNCQAQMEFDGNIEFRVTLTASRRAKVKDIRLEIPLAQHVARYMMGMGFKGGYRPSEFQWHWDVKNNQDALWIGDVNAGIQCSFKDENYIRPLNTNFYHSKPLNMPPSWYNDGRGGCTVQQQKNGTVVVTAYSGECDIAAGESLHFNFRLLLTPFKPLDTRAHWKNRYYHRFKPVAEIAAAGANVINVHHATEINPFINYPFLRPRKMKDYIDQAHERGMKVKIYYTVRELSNRAPEIFALRSLGDEILSYGPGGGFSWLQEHLGSDYIAGWLVPKLKDAAVINSGVSRWHNYYLEGLNWLVKNVGIDGLYIDDVAFDRTIMQRVRKILDRGRDGALIDLHSANQYNVRDGFASSANLYLEHFPYLNRIWFGEYFDYNAAPEYWLIEMSGIPFGVMGEMLQDGGNPWRGMIYGMTNRLPWAGDPAPIWKVWDDFGIQDSRMIGYWSPDCPIRTDHRDILATAYVKDSTTLVSLASWAAADAECRLVVDWKALGLDPARARFIAPAVKDFQEPAEFQPHDVIPVKQGKGWLLIITEKK